MIDLTKIKRDIINYGALKIYTTFLVISSKEVDPELFNQSQLLEIFSKKYDIIKINIDFVEMIEGKYVTIAKELLIFKLSKCSDNELSYMSNVDDEGKISSLILTKESENISLNVLEYYVGGEPTSPDPIKKVESQEEIPNNELGLYKYTEEVEGVLQSSHVVEVTKEDHGEEETEFDKVTDSNNQQVNDASAFMAQFAEGLGNFLSVSEVTKAYTLKYTPVEEGDLINLISGIRFGTSSQGGSITLTLNEPGILAFTQYFSYNQSTGKIVNWEDAETIKIEDNQTGDWIGLDLDNYDTDPHIVEVSAGSYTIYSDGGNRFILAFFRFERQPYSLYKKHELARKEEVNEVQSKLDSHISTSTERFRINENAIQQNANDIVTTNNKIGPVQIYKVNNNLPPAGEEFLDKIYRLKEEYYQCVKRGEGIHKEWAYNVSGTSEVTADKYEAFVNEVGLEYKDYLTSINEEYDPAYVNVKLFRNNGSIKLGSSSATGSITLFNKHAEHITSFKIGVKAYGSSKPSSTYIEDANGDEFEYLISNNVEETIIEIPYNPDTNNLERIYIESSSEYVDESGDEPVTIQCDKRLIITRIIADFGETTYEWIPLVAKDDIISKIIKRYNEESNMTFFDFPKGVVPLSITLNNNNLFFKSSFEAVALNGKPIEGYELDEIIFTEDERYMAFIGDLTNQVINGLIYINYDKLPDIGGIVQNSYYLFRPDKAGLRLYRHRIELNDDGDFLSIIDTNKNEIAPNNMNLRREAFLKIYYSFAQNGDAGTSGTALQITAHPENNRITVLISYDANFNQVTDFITYTKFTDTVTEL